MALIGDKFRMDVARWIIPGQIADPATVTPRIALRLWVRNAGLRAVLLFRIGGWLRAKGVPGITLPYQRYIQKRYGLEIKVGAPVGGGLYVAHTVGTVFVPRSAGENCSLIASVTVGMRNEHAFPVLGDGVFLGAGARVLGDVTLGDNAKVGANAVVIGDVPENTSVGGIPAKPLGSVTSEGNLTQVGRVDSPSG